MHRLGLCAWRQSHTHSRVLVRAIEGLFFSANSPLTSVFPTRKESRTKENTFAATIKLTADEVAAVDKILEANPVRGNRYGESDAAFHLWG